jgi:hypothetical protein
MSWNFQADSYTANGSIVAVPAQRTTPGIRFLTAGSSSPVVVPDPARPGQVYCIVADDPTNGGTGDVANLYIAISTDYGSTWGAPQLLESGPNNSLQYFPAASCDQSGNLFVAWYDTRNTGRANNKTANGDYYLDVYSKHSSDGGLHWTPAFRVNDLNNPLDPVTRAPNLEQNGFPFPPDTYRIGESISTAIEGGTALRGLDGQST